MLKIVLAIVALLGWVSVFALLWLMLLNAIVVDEILTSILTICGAIAISATAYLGLAEGR